MSIMGRLSRIDPVYLYQVRDSFRPNCRGCRLTQPALMDRFGMEDRTLVQNRVYYEDFRLLITDALEKFKPENTHIVAFLKRHTATPTAWEREMIDDRLISIAKREHLEGFSMFVDMQKIPFHFHKHLVVDR